MTSLSTDRSRIEVVHDEETVRDLVTSLRRRFDDVDERELAARVTAALVELGPVRVTSFLGILVERRIRDRHPEARRIASH